MENKRKILTPEEFEKIKNELNNDKISELSIIYTIILARDAGNSVPKIFAEMEIEENEIENINKLYNIDIKSISETDFLKKVPKRYNDAFKIMKEKSLKVNLKNIEDIVNENYEVIEEQIALEEEKEGKRISEYDLSKIPSSMFNDAKCIHSTNFEGTGANLDLQSFERDVYITGSIKGCRLISFTPEGYISKENRNLPSKEMLDKEQYETVIKGCENLDTFYISNIYAKNILELLEEPEMQTKNEWFFDKVFKENDRNKLDAWQTLSPELKIKHPEYFEILKSEVDEYKLSEIIMTTPTKILEDNQEWFFNLCRDNHGEISYKQYINEVFQYYNREFKIKNSEELLKRWIDHFYTRRSYYGEKEDIEEFWNSMDKTMQKNYMENNFLQIVNILERIYYEKINKEGYTKDCTLGLIKLKEEGRLNATNFKALAEGIPNLEVDKMQEPEALLDILIDNIYSERRAYFEETKDIEEFWNYMDKTMQENYMENNFLHIVNVLERKYDVKINKEGYTKDYTLGILRLKKEGRLNAINFKTLAEGITNLEVDKMKRPEALLDILIDNIYSERRLYLKEIKDIEEFWNYMDKTMQENYMENNFLHIVNVLERKYNEQINKKGYTKDCTLGLLELDKEEMLDLNNFKFYSEAIPKLGEEIVIEILKSNSEMMIEYAPQLFSAVVTMEKKEAIDTVKKIEHIFAQDNLPTFMRLYKYFELVEDKKTGGILEKISSGERQKLSPILSNTKSIELNKRIIFSDLMKISMDSNNKSLRKFVDKMEKGNEIYINFIKNGAKIDNLKKEEKDILQTYINTIYSMYEQSDAYNIDKKSDTTIRLSGNIEKDAIALGNRYAKDGKTTELPNLALKSFIGPYQELFMGITTISQIKEYMDKRVEQSNNEHRLLAKQKINLQEGDMIKGIKNHYQILQELFENGVRAGEFLGVDSHSDATPLDTDFSIILPENNGENLAAKIQNTSSGSFGKFFIILKNSKEKLDFTRTSSNNESATVKKLENRNSPEQIRSRINNRVNSNFPRKQLETFASNVIGNEHYGIRTGLGSTDIDYIVVNNSWDKKIGYELAMNGTYIPVVDMQSEKLLFSPEQYDEIRRQMQGLSYYNSGTFKMDNTAFIKQAKEQKEKLFPSESSKISIGELEAMEKRKAIRTVVEEALNEKMGLKLADNITGNLQNGFVEFIDTGSTGRGTNLPGDGDFDFSLKVDKSIIEDNYKLTKLKDALREVLANPSKEEGAGIEEPNGQFRYKKVQIEGIEDPLDIDITFMQKSEKVKYSTDMCVKDRLENLKKDNIEDYKYAISNIILAKKVLKEEGLYKKSTSVGATEYGGFGGVGVENWILENGGSFAKAMDTFLETASKSKDFNDFKEKYPIYDFGQNHMRKTEQHDSFIEGLTYEGYEKMQERFKEIRKELTPVVTEQEESLTVKEIIKNALGNEMLGIEDIQKAERDMLSKDNILNKIKENEDRE